MGRLRHALASLNTEGNGTITEPEAVPTAPERSPSRQKLADSIAEVRALEAEVAEFGALLSEAESKKWASYGALAEAEEALERAKPRPGGSPLKHREPYTFRSQEEADAYTELLNMPPPSIEDAKAAVASATDARDSAIANEQFHRKRLDQASQRLSWKRTNIDDALRLAVHYDPAMAALAAEAKALATRAAAAASAFNLATGGMLLQPNHPYFGSTTATDARTDFEGWAMLHRWRAALEALATDPDALLPMPAPV